MQILAIVTGTKEGFSNPVEEFLRFHIHWLSIRIPDFVKPIKDPREVNPDSKYTNFR